MSVGKPWSRTCPRSSNNPKQLSRARRPHGRIQGGSTLPQRGGGGPFPVFQRTPKRAFRRAFKGAFRGAIRRGMNREWMKVDGGDGTESAFIRVHPWLFPPHPKPLCLRVFVVGSRPRSRCPPEDRRAFGFKVTAEKAISASPGRPQGPCPRDSHAPELKSSGRQRSQLASGAGKQGGYFGGLGRRDTRSRQILGSGL